MILAIDIGNSNIVMGGYKDNDFCFVTRLSTNRHLEVDQYAVEMGAILSLYGVKQQAIQGIVVSSVVPQLTKKIANALSHYSSTSPYILSLKDCGNITVDIENPAEIGMDIVAAAIAVNSLLPLPAIIIDMGTATKLSALDAQHKLRGVAISPGLYVSLEALVKSTSQLSGISLEAPKAAIGRNTAQSMKSGVVLGTASLLDGLIDRFSQEMEGVQTIVATGGAAPVVLPHCRHTIQYSDTLLLKGLVLAYQRAQNQS